MLSSFTQLIFNSYSTHISNSQQETPLLNLLFTAFPPLPLPFQPRRWPGTSCLTRWTTPPDPSGGATPGPTRSEWRLASPSTSTRWTRRRTRPLWETETPWGRSGPRYSKEHHCNFNYWWVSRHLFCVFMTNVQKCAAGHRVTGDGSRPDQRHLDLGWGGEQVPHIWRTGDQQEGVTSLLACSGFFVQDFVFLTTVPAFCETDAGLRNWNRNGSWW